MSGAFIWIRATLDWDAPGARERISPRFRPKAELWDETFNVSYTEFRAELRRIAQLSFSRVAGATVTEDWDAIPEGALVLPVDDDDWFAPEVVEVLDGLRRPDAACYRWPSTFLERPHSLGHRLYLQRRRLFPWLRPLYFCTTNNYALPKWPGSRELAERHVAASEEFDGSAAVVAVPGRLSVMNRTLASQTSLGRFHRELTRGRLLRRYREYSSLYEGSHPSLPAWSHEYVDRVALLMRRLEPA